MVPEFLLPSNIKLGLIQLGLQPFGELWHIVKALVCFVPKPWGCFCGRGLTLCCRSVARSVATEKRSLALVS